MELFNRRRALVSPLLLAFIFNTFFNSVLSRHHIRHHRDRFKRQQGAHLYLPGSYITDNQEAEAGPWEEWSGPSPCSRTCGGGVSTQHRQCQFGHVCTGPTKRHFSCNTQDCPDLADFREQQCSEYDRLLFEGAKYQWIPYTKAPNPCELNCMPRGERFYYRHQQNVADGTRCNDEKFDVCVEGKCEPVGCDMMLGSNAREDRCRQCGGDGSSCKTYSGLLDMQDLQVGYNDILLVPAGATNVVVREVQPSNNYLAVRNTTGHYYLNGNWRIDFPRSMEFAGTKFHYERYPQGFSAPDTISCLGPTDETIFIVLLYQDKNVGVEYEYSVPNAVQPGTDTELYAWTFDAFTSCTATCGGGFQYRNVSCAGRRTLESADKSLCDLNNEPAAVQRCAEQPCEPMWVTKPWEKCSAPCGDGGTQTRQIYCEQIISNGVASVVDDQQCSHIQRPPAEQPCNQGVVCAQWHVDPWKPCDHLCDEGKQTRNVLCYRKVKESVEVVHEEECIPIEPKPESEKSCNLRPCEGLDWVTSEWSGCENKCGLNNETRKTWCATAKGEIHPDKLCENEPKPELVRQCNTSDSTCEFQWYASQWSECSAKCGSGVQTRRIYCGSVSNDCVKKVEEDKCDATKKYDGIQNCTGEQCNGEWYTGPWSKCSKQCGGGMRTRKVICLKENETVPIDECGGDTVAFSNEGCNNEACNTDEILAVEVTQPIDESEPSQEVSDYEIIYSEECDDGEWVDEELDDEVTDMTAFTKESPDLDSAFTDEYLMAGDDPTAYTGGDSVDTGSGSYFGTTDATLTTFEADEGSGDGVTEKMAVKVGSSTQGDFFVIETNVGDEETDTETTTEPITSESYSSDSTTDTPASDLQTTAKIGSSTEEDMLIIDEKYTEASVSSQSSESTESTEITSTESGGTSESVSTEDSSESSDITTVPSATESSVAPALTTVKVGLSTENVSSATETSISTQFSSATESSVATDLTTEIETEASVSTQSSDSTESADITSTESDVTSESDSSDTTTVSLTTESSIPPALTTEKVGSSTASDEFVIVADLISTTPEGSKSTVMSEIESTTTEFTTESISTEIADTTTSDLTTTPDLTTTEVSSTKSQPESPIESGGGDSEEETLTVTTEVPSVIKISTDVSETSTEFASLSTTERETVSSITTSTELVGSTETSSEISEMTEMSTETVTSTEVSPTSEVIEISTDVTEETTTISGSTEVDIWSTTLSSMSPETTTGDEEGTTSITEIFTSPRLRKCKRRKTKTCKTTPFGCCSDKITPAEGPFDKGCPTHKTCKETKFGCCEDNVSPAMGKKFKGCPPSLCKETLFGCCSDEKTASQGTNNEGCPPPPPKCLKSKYGCCPDNSTAATGSKGKGCEKEVTTPPPTPAPPHCSNSTYGCCPDGQSVAQGADFEGCNIFDNENCNKSYFRCCPDGVTSAKGPEYKGCEMPCEKTPYGCCEDRITAAHGYNREGCCLVTSHGCCPDNIVPAQGPNLEGCGCQYSPYRCCPDNITSARGPSNEGCGCRYTEHGCCPDDYNPAVGPEYQGCLCHTFQFGCCPDGVTVAKGPHQQGCGCRNTEFGCCTDDQTPAQGPNYTGCGCDASKYGCCPDGISESKGENFENCENVPVNLQDSCTLTKERGSCRNYTVKWFYDMEYGGCSRFWYGGCEGNANRFKSSDECQAVCVKPEGREKCLLPKVAGPCEGYYPHWYYDKERKSCAQFIYGGCLGNNNRFETSDECSTTCVRDTNIDACEQQREEGPCHGNYTRWYFEQSASACLPFTYGGCKPNSNNFPTEQSCKQQCSQPGRKKDSCSLPRAQGNCTDKDSRWYYDVSEKRCMPFYFTGCEGNNNNFNSRESCEADCPQDIEKETCQLPAEIGDCANYTDRWYYDTKDKHCRQFYYGGCGGNDNNFISERDCQQRCENLVTAAPPLEGATEPFKKEFCFLASDAGRCRNSEAKWYYDSADGVCKQFLYGGCEGNQNNFATSDECRQHCGDAQDLCTLPVVFGPCSAELTQWYYNQSTDSCNEFNYGGCFGNDNRFEDKPNCERRCKQGPISAIDSPLATQAPPEELHANASVCLVPVDTGNCSESIPSYYYDRQTQKCSPFVYTGCGGNGNRYNTEEQCERQCGKFRDQDVCSLPKETGPCRGYFIKAYYETSINRCAQFIYGGCEGNGNRFSSVEECESVCLTHEEIIPPPRNESKSAICRLPVDVGSCVSGYHKRWYFDDTRGECIPFIYSGCGGNLNSFKSFQSCLTFCRELVAQTEPPNEIVDEETEKDPHPCQRYADECSSLRCEYGIEAYVDGTTNCNVCRCHDPCIGIECPEGTKCAVDLNPNRNDSQDSNFIPVCREINKPGGCPELRGNALQCDRECENDADCSVDLKCCLNGCGTSCVVPTDLLGQMVSTPSLAAYTKPPISLGSYAPQIDDSIYEPEIKAGEGDYATLRCAVRGNPTPSISWQKGNLVIDGTQARYRLLLDGALQIITLHRTDSGIYVCIAENGIGQPFRSEIRLEVTDSAPHMPSILGDEDAGIVTTIGSPTAMHCHAIGFPFPAITWWKENKLIPFKTNRLEIRKDHSLIIHTVGLSDLGVYTCQAYNGVGKATSWSVTLRAIGPVRSTIPGDQQFMKYLIEAPEKPTTTEQPRPQYPYRPAPNQTVELPPYIPPLVVRPTPEPHQPPPYTEPSPEIIPNEHIPNEILAPPAPTQDRPIYMVPVRTNISLAVNRFAVGSDISIRCDVDGHPIPQVQWFKDHTVIQPTDSIKISESHRLTILKANETNSGRYSCQASNQFSRSVSSADIVVEGISVHPNCTDNPFFANCQLIVRANYCTHKYYARFCCRSCTEAGQLPSHGPHLSSDKQTALKTNLVKRK